MRRRPLSRTCATWRITCWRGRPLIEFAPRIWCWKSVETTLSTTPFTKSKESFTMSREGLEHSGNHCWPSSGTVFTFSNLFLELFNYQKFSKSLSNFLKNFQKVFLDFSFMPITLFGVFKCQNRQKHFPNLLSTITKKNFSDFETRKLSKMLILANKEVEKGFLEVFNLRSFFLVIFSLEKFQN